MLDIRTRIRTDLNPSKRIRFQIRSENIHTVFIPTLHAVAVRSYIDANIFVASALVDMYGILGYWEVWPNPRC
jgi:vacuolar-type H+-ATPase subunit D/Vma8